MTRCLFCDKELVLEQTTNNYLKSNFRLRKFCNKECRIKHWNKSKSNQYNLKETEHNQKLKTLNAFIKGRINLSTGKRASYNPDIIQEETDYEMELFRNMKHLKQKVDKWDNSRKHVLVLTISDQTKDLFDEVYFLTKDSLIKEK